MDKFSLSKELANITITGSNTSDNDSNTASDTHSITSDSTTSDNHDITSDTHSITSDNDTDGTVETTETSASGEVQEAFDEETGEINWDCPCLGEMVKEPCGEKFKAAFSCFVYSKEEVKGSDCVEQFREMQKCFQDHPEIYGQELAEGNSEKEHPEAVDTNGDGITVQTTSSSDETDDETADDDEKYNDRED